MDGVLGDDFAITVCVRGMNQTNFLFCGEQALR
jgi:hypothetical protein